MNKVIWSRVLPLTFITFCSLTKWWEIDVIDGPKEIFWGFPLPMAGPGWHTSLSLQVFVMEALANLLIYFLFWIFLFYVLRRLFGHHKKLNILTFGLWILAFVHVAIIGIIAAQPGNLFFLKRPFAIEVISSGFNGYGTKFGSSN